MRQTLMVLGVIGMLAGCGDQQDTVEEQTAQSEDAVYTACGYNRGSYSVILMAEAKPDPNHADRCLVSRVGTYIKESPHYCTRTYKASVHVSWDEETWQLLGDGQCEHPSCPVEAADGKWHSRAKWSATYMRIRYGDNVLSDSTTRSWEFDFEECKDQSWNLWCDPTGCSTEACNNSTGCSQGP